MDPVAPKLCAALGKLLQAGDLICLSGQLGAGKTVFSRGIGGGWGAIPPLSSPTYNLAHEHRRAQDETRLLHIDLYRIDGPADAETLGLDDISIATTLQLSMGRAHWRHPATSASLDRHRAGHANSRIDHPRPGRALSQPAGRPPAVYRADEDLSRLCCWQSIPPPRS